VDVLKKQALAGTARKAFEKAGVKTCARRQEKQAPGQTKLVRPHHSCQFEIMRPDLLGPGTMALDPTFGSFYLIRTSFTLGELVLW
jgi:hypothetical protein